MNGTEQRRDCRFPLAGWRMEVRKSRLGSLATTPICRLADISSNGLSFVAHGDPFTPLDKVTFTLQVREQEIRGKGVICYKQSDSTGRWRYGLMFLEVSREVASLLREYQFEPREVRNLARNLADKTVLDGCKTTSERDLLHKQLLLYEAVSAFLDRLLLLEHPPLPVTVTLQGVRVEDGDGAWTIEALPQRPGYAASSGEHFVNVFEALMFLRDRFFPGDSKP